MDTTAKSFRALLRYGLEPAADTELGISLDGTISFRDVRGEFVRAYPGDEIEVAADGWTLHSTERRA